MTSARPLKAVSTACPPCGALLAEGGMSRVFECEGGDPPRVLKRALDSRHNETLLREARMGAEISHPALLPVLDYGLDDEGLAWLLLPRCLPGPFDLREPRVLFEALGEVADALDLLHARGWIHADLKSANLLAGDPEGSAPLLLADLGMAGRVGEAREGGSLAYLSPGRLKGEGLHPADDRHALAVLAYECLAGRLPFVDQEGDGLLRAIRSGDTLPLSRFRSDLPSGLDPVFEDVFSGEHPPGSAMELMDRLGAASGLAARPRTLFYRPAPHPDLELRDLAARWLAGESARGSRLGRSLLLEGSSAADARLLRESLPGLPWLEEPDARGAFWAVRMEEPLAPGELPQAAVFGERDMDADQAGFLRSRPETLILERRDWSAAWLRPWLEASLSSVAHASVAPGDRELDFLAESSAGGLDGLEEALDFLLDRQLLRDENGVAAFQADPSKWRKDWQSRGERETAGLPALALRLLGLFSRLALSLDEGEIARLLDQSGAPLGAALKELKDLGWLHGSEDGRLSLMPGRHVPPSREALPGLDDAWLAEAWRRAEDRPLSRLSLIRCALDEDRRDWLSGLSASALLLLAQTLSLDRVESMLAEHPAPPAAVAIFAVMADLRRGRLPEAVLGFWSLEPGLDLESSAELSRRLCNTLLWEKSVEEGFAFLDRWRRLRFREIEGTELEIRVAAREVVSYCHHGAASEAEELLARYRREFAGRPGFWFLDWAESLLNSERQEYESAARFMERALEQAEGEAGATDRFSLTVHLAELLLMQNRMEEGERFLERARLGAEETGRPEYLRYVHNSTGLFLLGRERFAEAEKQFRRSLQIAREEGAWRRPTAARNNLALALYQQGEYGRMEPAVAEVERACEISERLADLLSERNLLALILTGCGRLEEAERHLDLSLPVARETGARRMEAQLLRKRGRLRLLQGEKTGALEDYRFSREIFESLGIEDEAAFSRLGEIDVEPSGAGTFLDEALARFRGEGQGMARLMTLRLRAQARRLAGDHEGAARDLEAAEGEASALANPELLWPLKAEAAELALSRGKAAEARRLLAGALEILRLLAGRFNDAEAAGLYLARPDRRACLQRFTALSDLPESNISGPPASR